MVQFLPNYPIEDIGPPSHPERTVAEALISTLPDRCIIYHSYPWLESEGNKLREAESDFIVLDPKYGFIALEVKGGDLVYDQSQMLYFNESSGRKKDITDPFKQARNSMHKIEKLLKERCNKEGVVAKFSFGNCVVFPDCIASDKPPGASACILLDSTHLPSLGDRVIGALRAHAGTRPELSSDLFSLMQKALRTNFVLRPSLSRQILKQNEGLAQLTDQQYQAVRFLKNHRRACITGVAGSGKTLLAIYKAELLAETMVGSDEILFLCYNSNLAKWVSKNLNPVLSSRIRVRTYHSIVSDFRKIAQLPFRPPLGGGQQFWDSEAPALLEEAIDYTQERFGAVVIDEGQDFHDSWWTGIEFLNRDEEDGSLYVFMDPAQNLYGRTYDNLPAMGQPYQLDVNCRNTVRIAEYCSDIITSVAKPYKHSVEGTPPEIQVIPRDQHYGTVFRLLKRLINVENIRPGQISILSPWSAADSSFGQKESLPGGILLTDKPLNWLAGNEVLVTSIRAFKGLEADVVILTDLVAPGSSPALKAADYYVACSRAKNLLFIFTSESFPELV